MSCPTETVSTKYAKRPGTSGIRGHLYETKLLSLIYFRAIHDDSIEEFHLATNVDNIGAFDDICFRVKWKALDEPVVVFIQVKHRENNQHLSLENKTDLVKYFKSYLDIKRKFHPNNKDALFKGRFSKIECRFVIYTTAEVRLESELYNHIDKKLRNSLNNLVGTRIDGFQSSSWLLSSPILSLNLGLTKIVLEEHFTALAQQMAKCILGELKDSHLLMQNEYVIRYHVILAQKVFDVSESQTNGHRIARFRHDFFNINEKFLRLFKDELCTEILKRRKCVVLKDFNVFSSLHEITDVEELYKRCRSFITYRNGVFVCLDKTIPDSASVLNKINRSHDTIHKTVELAVKECLPSLEFIVPASFGNIDLLIRGDEAKIEKRLNYLTTEFVKLTQQSNLECSNDCIFIDTSLGEGFLQHNGGIASAVGNLLISNEDNQLKFNHKYESLGPLAKRLFDKLQRELNNSLFDYKFKVIIEVFPKLSLELINENCGENEYDPDVESEFLKKLVFCTSQCTEEKVEETLIHEINGNQSEDVKINSDAIFLQFHDAVQKWWMSAGEAPYLTKEDSLYHQAVKLTSSQPLTSILNITYRYKNKNYILSEDAVNSIKLHDLPAGTVIVSDNSALTVAKFNKYLNKHCIVLDLEYIFNLSAKDDKTLRSELTKTDEVQTVIVIFEESLVTASSMTKIENIVDSLQDKKVIIVTGQISVKNTRQYFPEINNEVKDERTKLIDMSNEAQTILKNTKVIFQSNEVNLEQVLDDESINYVGGGVLLKLIRRDERSKKNIIGKPVINSSCETSYIQRTVTKLRDVTRRLPTDERRSKDDDKKISTLYDLEENVVLIVGDPGMGKSTLLTHLSLKTKKLHPTVWILRINLLEHSRQFSEWQEGKICIDILESLNFLCFVAISVKKSKLGDVQVTLEECNGTVVLKDCTGDDWTVFQLRLFLHYFNTKNIIILLDGFDEICPTYAHEVLTLIKAVENFHQKHKMWITSRSYDKIITILELKFRTLYKIKPLNDSQQHFYLKTFWNRLKINTILNSRWLPALSVFKNEIQNIHDFSMYMLENVDLKLMKKSNLPVQSKTDMPFVEVSLSLVKYLSDLFDTIMTKMKKERFLERAYNIELADLFIVSTDALQKLVENIYSLHFNDFVATPLHLNMIADYLCIQISTSKEKRKWNTNIFEIYESFVETKLKKIRFQEKNKHDMSKPDNVLLYKRVRADTMDKHKKLATYAIYDRCLFDDDELKQCKEMINELKEGEERTGIICNVVNDIPIFVHSTFAEYFAVEHICDLLKSNRNPKSIWEFILNIMFFKNINALILLDAKVKVEEELTKLIEQHKQIIFELLLEQSENTKSRFGDIKSSLCEAIRHDLRHLVSLLLSTVEFNLEDKNVMNFINIVKETNMLMVAVKMEFEDVVVTIVDSLRVIDESKLSALFENMESSEFKKDLKVLSTDELVQKLHSHVWTHMDIVPEWENLAEFSGQIYFI